MIFIKDFVDVVAIVCCVILILFVLSIPLYKLLYPIIIKDGFGSPSKLGVCFVRLWELAGWSFMFLLSIMASTMENKIWSFICILLIPFIPAKITYNIYKEPETRNDVKKSFVIREGIVIALYIVFHIARIILN